MKTLIISILILLLASGYAFLQYRKQENEKILKLEKIRQEAQAAERRRQELIVKKEIEQKAKILNTRLSELQNEVVKLTAEADECKHTLNNAKSTQLENKAAANVTVDIVQKKLANYNRIKSNLERAVAEFKSLDKDPMIHCFFSCLPETISFYRKHRSGGKEDVLTGYYMPDHYHSVHYRYRNGRNHRVRVCNGECSVYFVCYRHNNRWTKSLYQQYKNLRKRWRDTKYDYSQNKAKLQHYEKLIEKTQTELNQLRDSAAGSDEKIAEISRKYQKLNREIQEKQREIKSIQNQLERLKQ